ncbi:hypothetical protein Tco_1395263 [Tanacetum coccineum]
MLTAPESSPSRITFSPFLSPQTHPSTSQQPPTPPFMQTIHDAEEPATMPHDSSQPSVQSLGSDEGNLKDPSKQGRRIGKIDQNPSISLVQDEGTSWIQEDAKIQGKTSADTEILLDQEELTELVDFGSGEKGEKDISTANISVSTASAIPKVSTAGVSTTKSVLSTVIPEVNTVAENLMYIRRSVEKRKDKGKAIMKEDESVQKKTKKQLEQERLSHEAAIRLQEQTRTIAKLLDVREEVVAEADPTQVIDWSDPVVLRYHAQQDRSFSKAKSHLLKDKRLEKFQGQLKNNLQEEKEVSEEELKKLLVIVPVEEVYIEALQVKYPIIDWEVFTEESRSY